MHRSPASAGNLNPANPDVEGPGLTPSGGDDLPDVPPAWVRVCGSVASESQC